MTGNSDRNLFLAGTQSVRNENALHLLEYDEEAGDIRVVAVMDHASPVVALAACPSREGLVLTASSAVRDAANVEFEAALWSLDGASGSAIGERPSLTRKLAFGAHDGAIRECGCLFYLFLV